MRVIHMDTSSVFSRTQLSFHFTTRGSLDFFLSSCPLVYAVNYRRIVLIALLVFAARSVAVTHPFFYFFSCRCASFTSTALIFHVLYRIDLASVLL